MYHDFIRIKTGDELVNSQYVEFLLKILCELFNPLGFQIDVYDLLSNNHSKKTLGQLKKVLEETDLLNGDFIQRLDTYVKNRTVDTSKFKQIRVAIKFIKSDNALVNPVRRIPNNYNDIDVVMNIKEV